MCALHSISPCHSLKVHCSFFQNSCNSNLPANFHCTAVFFHFERFGNFLKIGVFRSLCLKRCLLVILFDFKICFSFLSGFPTASPVLYIFLCLLSLFFSLFVLPLSALNEAITVSLLLNSNLFIFCHHLSEEFQWSSLSNLHGLDQFCLVELLAIMKCFITMLSVLAVTNHTWLLNISNVASMTEDFNLNF